MWFRNLVVFQLIETPDLTDEAWQEALTTQAFKPCAGMDAHSLGWEAPLGREAEALAHRANGCVMLCARREERILPAAVVREAVEERALAIEEAEGRPVGRKERSRLRDDITFELLPRAFTRSQRIFAYLDLVDGWMVVDTSSQRRAEDIASLLRESLGSLKVRPLAVAQAPASVLTGWLRGQAHPGLELGGDCDMKEPVEQGAVVRCRRLDLAGEEIAAHLDAGHQVVRLAVTWQERIDCLLGDDAVVRRVRFTDLIQEEAAAVEAEDHATRMDADFALMSLELRGFIGAMVEWFGGLESASA